MSQYQPLSNQPDSSDAQSKASSAMIDAIDTFIGSGFSELIRKGSYHSESKSLKNVANHFKLSRCRTDDSPNFRVLKAQKEVSCADEGQIDTGFTTGNSRPIRVNAKTTAQAERLMNGSAQQLLPSFGGNDSSMSLGFKTANNKEIKISEKRIVEAQKLLMERNCPEVQESFQMGFSTAAGNKVKISNSKLRKAKNMLQENVIEQDSVGSFGFTTGNSRGIKVSSQAMKKAMAILNSPAKVINEPRKDTKPKVGSVLRDQVNVKTVNLKPRGTNARKLLIVNKDPNQSTSSQKQKEYHNYVQQFKTHFQSVRLKDLNATKTVMSDYKQPETFLHNQSSCQLLFCLLCKQNIDEPIITKDILFGILSLKHRKLRKQQFDQSYSQTVFKLSKYTKYFPDLVNKKLQPSNILEDIQKRVCLQFYSKKQSAVKSFCTGKIAQGAVMVLLVKSIKLIEERNTFYLELSDGWYSVCAIVKNELRSPSGRASNNYYVSSLIREDKIYQGSKIKISGWRKYPIGNIMMHLGMLENEEIPAIEIFYNGINPAPSNCKLGLKKQPFYRPLNRCKCNGGSVELAQLMVLRKLVSSSETYFYMRMADNECNTYIVRMAGGEELSTYYRPKQTYQVRKLRFLDDRLLEFTRISSIIEVKNPDSQTTHEKTLQTLLYNNQVRPVQIYDILIQSAQDFDSIQYTVVVTTIHGHVLTLKGEALHRDILKFIGKMPLLIQELHLQDPETLLFRQTTFSRVRTDFKESFYKSLINVIK